MKYEIFWCVTLTKTIYLFCRHRKFSNLQCCAWGSEHQLSIQLKMDNISKIRNIYPTHNSPQRWQQSIEREFGKSSSNSVSVYFTAHRNSQNEALFVSPLVIGGWRPVRCDTADRATETMTPVEPRHSQWADVTRVTIIIIIINNIIILW